MKEFAVLYLIYIIDDHIVPLSASKSLKSVYSGNNYEEIVFPSSYLSVSREAHLNLWPKVCKMG